MIFVNSDVHTICIQAVCAMCYVLSIECYCLGLYRETKSTDLYSQCQASHEPLMLHRPVFLVRSQLPIAVYDIIISESNTDNTRHTNSFLRTPRV